MKTILIAFASTLVIGGCTVTSNDPAPAPAATVAPTEPAPVDGTLTLQWTIDGSTDPNRCNQSVATTISVNVVDSNGASAGVFQQACQAFATSITLAAGSYSATAVMLDGAGQPRTTAVNVNPFNIAGNDEIRIPIDFPADSFR